MKTIAALFLLAAACGVAVASDAPKPACCVAHDTADGAPPDAAAPLSARSIYQLDATWTDDAGHAVRLADFRGAPVVLTMFFASCEYACPMLVNDMRRLRESLPADVRERTRFVLVSFDTARDTPAALRAYRERMDLDAAWTLLHGDAAAVQELAMVLGVKYKEDARGQFSHSNLITVLDDAGEIAHQRTGLAGDVSAAAQATIVAAK